MQAQKTEEENLATTSTVLPVREVIAIVQEWVDLQARQLPNFGGAYLWAGITAMPPDAPFPLYRDVDVVVVLPEGAQDDTVEVSYRGLMLEVISISMEAHQDAEATLANPSHGPNMATTQILADPTGILEPLHKAVAEGYRKRRWIEARCAKEKESVEKHLATMRRASTPSERADSAWAFLSMLSGLLALSQLRRPTTRRTLALLRELLEAEGRPDLNEAALTVMGSVHMGREEVQAILDQSVTAYERAIEVYTTPTPYGFTMRAFLLPYLAEATQEMINEGNHREAIFWISALNSESYLVLQNDAPDAEKSIFAAQLHTLHTILGYTSSEVWAEHVVTAERLAQEIYRIADTHIAQHPE